MGITNIIRADNVKKVYQMRGGNVHALRGITLDIFKGEYLSIMNELPINVFGMENNLEFCRIAMQFVELQYNSTELEM